MCRQFVVEMGTLRGGLELELEMEHGLDSAESHDLTYIIHLA